MEEKNINKSIRAHLNIASVPGGMGGRGMSFVFMIASSFYTNEREEA